MHYYTVHLPWSINKALTYSSPDKLPEGVRVIVNVGAKAALGICGAPTAIPQDGKINYKPILEVLDIEPVLPRNLMSLGLWMADYYHCSAGKVLFAMLPSRLQPDLDAGVKWCGSVPPPEFTPLFEILAEGEMNLLQLRKKLPNYSLYLRIEEAENLGLVEVNRKLKHKDKPKTANYILITNRDFNSDELPLRQREAWELLTSEPNDTPMAAISAKVSYSTLKAMVKKGIISIEPRRVPETSFTFETPPEPKQIILNEAQQKAIADISSGFGHWGVDLLFGITGSGKTEVYIAIMRKYLAAGKNIIFLIPEIALTPQMVERFLGCFGDTLAIQHSQLSESERLRQWQSVKRGEKRIVVGARSAIFSPIANLGLIVVDEEHEGTYKQDSTPRYNGRDMAILRGKLEGAQVILGSATPSLESWFNTSIGKNRLHTLSARPLAYQLPQVLIEDLRDGQEADLISPTLLNAIDERLTRKEQVILFQNRRGYASFLQCLKCGKLVTCSNCEISMTYHRDSEEVHCHYCGSHYPSPRKCPACGSYSFAYGAAGTQKVEQILRLLFPTARMLRMDSDSARHKDTYNSMHQRMKSQEVDILLGTQMISKGLDFPHVTLVGVIMADISLNVPDFRAAERTFQLLTQVAGRSGRSDLPGEVIIQTYNPEHYAIVAASRQDFTGFASEELEYRRKLCYPPFYRMARILWQGIDLRALEEEMQALEPIMQAVIQQFSPPRLLMIGPSPAPLPKVGNLFRYHLIFKADSASTMQQALSLFLGSLKLPAKIQQQVDIDPMYLM